MEALISILITLVIFALIFWLILWLVDSFIPDPPRQFIRIALAIIAILVLLGYLLRFTPYRVL